MKNIIKYILLVLAICMGILSCSKHMDDYRKYTNGPRQYTGKVDSVLFRSGDGRVVFDGLLTSDPKISKVVIYWNTRRDSVLLNVVKTVNVDTLLKSIPLPEGRYNFEVISYDSKGIPSIPVAVSGSSYGDNYKSSLYNRPIKNAEKVGDSVIINWYDGDETSPFTRIDFTSADNVTHVLNVTNKQTQTVLNNYKTGSKFKMQAYYLPDETAIDTFKAPVQLMGVTENVSSVYLKNYQSPIQRSDNGTGKWGLAKDWICNSAVLNQRNSGSDPYALGGWSNQANNCFHFESKDWGGDPIVNGKEYQTVTLPAGNYKMECEAAWSGGSLDINIVAAIGSTLPDIDKLDNNSNVLGRDHNNGFSWGWRSMTFSLSQTTTVSLGWVLNLGSSSGIQFTNVKLWSLQQ